MNYFAVILTFEVLLGKWQVQQLESESESILGTVGTRKIPGSWWENEGKTPSFVFSGYCNS
jgi:hypothetical protein